MSYASPFRALIVYLSFPFPPLTRVGSIIPPCGLLTIDDGSWRVPLDHAGFARRVFKRMRFATCGRQVQTTAWWEAVSSIISFPSAHPPHRAKIGLAGDPGRAGLNNFALRTLELSIARLSRALIQARARWSFQFSFRETLAVLTLRMRPGGSPVRNPKFSCLETNSRLSVGRLLELVSYEFGQCPSSHFLFLGSRARIGHHLLT
jgi:hypothetical protein